MDKKFIVIVLVVMMVFVTMMGAGFFILWNKMSAAPASAAQTEEGALEQEEANAIRPLYALDTLIVNLGDDNGKRYLRLTMQLEMDNEEMRPEIDSRMPQIRDSILMILPEKQFADIQSIQGKVALRDEIMGKLNGILTTGQVSNIYYTEFVVQ